MNEYDWKPHKVSLDLTGIPELQEALARHILEPSPIVAALLDVLPPPPPKPRYQWLIDLAREWQWRLSHAWGALRGRCDYEDEREYE